MDDVKDARGLEGEGAVSMDPFTPRLAFIDRVSPRLATLGEERSMKPLEPIDTTVDSFLDIEKLERLAAFQGCFRSPRSQSVDELPEEVSEALKNLEPQFILRNLSRAVRDVDPSEPLAMEMADTGRVNMGDVLQDSRTARIERVDLLESLTPEFMASQHATMRTLVQKTRWEEHFSREIKEDFQGPIWKYDPHAVPEVDADGDAPGATE